MLSIQVKTAEDASVEERTVKFFDVDTFDLVGSISLTKITKKRLFVTIHGLKDFDICPISNTTIHNLDCENTQVFELDVQEKDYEARGVLDFYEMSGAKIGSIRIQCKSSNTAKVSFENFKQFSIIRHGLMEENKDLIN